MTFPIPASGWTEERVELLTKLWREGLSGGQIAQQLRGISRNAIIGKIHRLGLSGRGAASKPRRLPRARGQTIAKPSPGNKTMPHPSGTRVYFIAAARPLPPSPPSEPGLRTILTIAAQECRWPIGDPVEPSFTLCGRRACDGRYCAAHAARSRQSVGARKPSNPADLMRSLRRYV